MRANPIIVAYRVMVVPGYQPDVKEYAPPSNYKSDEAIRGWYERKSVELLAQAANQPYTGTFDEVHLVDLNKQLVATFSSHGREVPALGPATPDGAPDGDTSDSDSGSTSASGSGDASAAGAGKNPPISVAVRDWLLREYPEAWPDTPHPARATPEAFFIGFNVDLFLDILGTECMLPQYAGEAGSQLPLSLWYGNSDHRDIGRAVTRGYKNLSWPLVLRAHGLSPRSWEGPGVSPEADLTLATTLAYRTGLVRR